MIVANRSGIFLDKNMTCPTKRDDSAKTHEILSVSRNILERNFCCCKRQMKGGNNKTYFAKHKKGDRI